MKENMDYQSILDEVAESVKPLIGTGKKANYIPELENVDDSKFGMCLRTMDGQVFKVGDADDKFSIQSISKVFTLSMVLSVWEKELSKRVGVEPTGNAFNSLVQLEFEKGIPRNPFINAGALVVSDILLTHFDNPQKAFREFMEEKLGVSNLVINPTVAVSENEVGYLNASLANFLKSFNNLDSKVNEVLDFYYNHCAIEMSCSELSKAFLLFANHGLNLENQTQVITKSQTKRLNAMMQSCGFYDEAGEFTFKVGLPGKSGVGGGIVAVYPQQFTIAVWSPGLNEKGNSLVGMKALELFTTKSGMSIF